MMETYPECEGCLRANEDVTTSPCPGPTHKPDTCEEMVALCFTCRERSPRCGDCFETNGD